MPHLPPPTVTGGSVKIKIPVYEVDDYGNQCGERLFKEPKLVIEPYPPGGKKKYAFEQHSASDPDAQIYKIEIHGHHEDEVFEFRPKDGRCKIEIYYAVSEELPLRHVNKWLEPPENEHEHEHGHE